jgi:hypothetical protein
MTSRINESCQSRLARRDRIIVERRQPLEPLEGTLDGRAMDLEPLGEFGEARLRCLTPPIGDEADHVRLLRKTAVRLERRDRVELTTRRAHGPLEVRRFRIEDAVELTAKRARDLAGLDLEERAGRPDAAQEGPDRFAILRRHDTAITTDAPRDRETEVAEAVSKLWRRFWLDDELEVGPAAREAQRAAGEEMAT